MVSRSTWLHLRIPFSYFLLPVFLFAFAISPTLNLGNHFLLYPASNGYNSYFDKDEKSIGGLENPPPVKRELYWTSLILDGIAVLAGWLLVGAAFAAMIFIYGGVSKMYSHPAVRLKKYPITGWAITGLFQGLFTFLMCFIGVNGAALSETAKPEILYAGLLTSIMLWGNYPMTQVYQHEEDSKHGDRTMSLLLGIRGTFIFVQLVFAFAATGFVFYFSRFVSPTYGMIFLAALFPVVVYFLYWFYKVWNDETMANFRYTMRLNFISATCLNVFFILLFLHPMK